MKLPRVSWFVGPIVFEECRYNGKVITALEEAVNDGGMVLLDDSTVRAAEFLQLLESYGLGDGETECLTYARAFGFVVCTDDKKARKVCSTVLGDDRTVGVLRLIKTCVQTRLISSVEAMNAYELMKAKGAFLPELTSDYFANSD